MVYVKQGVSIKRFIGARGENHEFEMKTFNGKSGQQTIRSVNKGPSLKYLALNVLT